MLEALPVADNDSSYDNLLAWEWRLNDELMLVVVNYSNSTARGRLKFDISSSTDEVFLI